MTRQWTVRSAINPDYGEHGPFQQNSSIFPQQRKEKSYSVDLYLNVCTGRGHRVDIGVLLQESSWAKMTQNDGIVSRIIK